MGDYYPPGGGTSFNPGGTSDQFLDGTGAPKDLMAADISSAIAGTRTITNLNCPTLGANAVGYSDVVDLTAFTGAVDIEAWSDIVAGTSGCRVEGSFDNSNWFLLQGNTTDAAFTRGSGGRFRASLGCQPHYLRLKRTNSATPQGFWIGLMHKIAIPTTGFSKALLNPSTLSGGATYTSAALDVSGYDYFQFLLYSNVASAANGVVVEMSFDGSTNWRKYSQTSLVADTGLYVSGDSGSSKHANFIRIVYTNGVSAQGQFNIGYLLTVAAAAGAGRIYI